MDKHEQAAVIAKKDLKHSVYYAGISRTVKIARWNANQSVFYGQRARSPILDFFRHPEDGLTSTGADTFAPYKEVEHPGVNIPISY